MKNLSFDKYKLNMSTYFEEIIFLTTRLKNKS